MVASRNTRQKELLSETAQSFETFFDAEDLLTKVKDKKLGIATVYRFLKEEVKKGRLHAYNCNRRTVYSKTKQHCHMVCKNTGKTMHFDIDDIDFIKKKIPGSIISIQIEVTGICNDCD